MASIDWPSSLPQELQLRGNREEPPTYQRRTQMDKGPDKVAPNTVANPNDIDGTQVMTEAQVADLYHFIETTLDRMSLRFNWTHPRTGNSVEMRFREKPSWTRRGPDRYTVNLKLEVMP